MTKYSFTGVLPSPTCQCGPVLPAVGLLGTRNPCFLPSGGPPLPSFPALGTGAGRKEAGCLGRACSLPPLSPCSALSLPLLTVRYRSISVPGPPTLPMADTYAVVQKRGAPAGTGPGTRAPNSTDTPIYSQVAPRIQRPVSHTENAQGTTALGRGELRPYRDEELRASTCSSVPRSHKVRERLSATRSSGRDPAWPRPQAPNCRGSSPQMSSRSRLSWETGLSKPGGKVGPRYLAPPMAPPPIHTSGGESVAALC